MMRPMFFQKPKGEDPEAVSEERVLFQSKD